MSTIDLKNMRKQLALSNEEAKRVVAALAATTTLFYEAKIFFALDKSNSRYHKVLLMKLEDVLNSIRDEVKRIILARAKIANEV